MKTLYLHIGMPKTATTYIQYLLSVNNKVLQEEGYTYPDFGVRFSEVGENRNGHFLISVLKDEHGNRLFEKERKIEEECFQKIYAMMENYPNVILSDEVIWNFAEDRRDENFWKNLKERLAAHGITLKIIVYLRRQDLYIQSVWAQAVKERSLSIPLHEFIETKEYNKKKLDYAERLDAIAGDVGKENMIVRVYEKGQYSGTEQTIISDFLNAVGLTCGDRFQGLDFMRNTSLSGIYLEVKRELNKIEGFHRENRWLSIVLRRIMAENNDLKPISQSEFLTYEKALAMEKKYEASNDRVAEEYLGKKGGKLFEEKIIKNEEQAGEYELADYVGVFAKLLEYQRNKIEELREKNEELKKRLRWTPRGIVSRTRNKFLRTFTDKE